MLRLTGLEMIVINPASKLQQLEGHNPAMHFFLSYFILSAAVHEYFDWSMQDGNRRLSTKWALSPAELTLRRRCSWYHEILSFTWTVLLQRMQNLSPRGQMLSYDLAVPNNITSGTAEFRVPLRFWLSRSAKSSWRSIHSWYFSWFSQLFIEI